MRFAGIGLRLTTALAAVGFAAVPASAGTPPAPGFHLEQVVSGYKRPLYVLAHGNPNYLYVVEQRGIVRVLTRTSAAAPWVKAGVFLDMRGLVAGPFVGRGLLGMAFDPAYYTNGKFYVFYTRRSDDPRRNGDIVIAEFKRVSNLKANLGSRRVVLVVDHPSDFHFGGWIGFGPDGYLWATTGHATGSPDSTPQATNSRLAKLLRFNPHARRGRLAQIPADNPFVGIDGDDFVWAYGMRNPWRASFDRLTHDLWLSDVGLDSWEEVNHFAPNGSSKGANLGWRLCEANHVIPIPETGDEPCNQPATVLPVIEYPHTDGNCSVTGGYVYRGSAYPSLYGRYFYGDYCTGNIWSVATDHKLGDPIEAPLDTTSKITSFGEDAAGEIYVTGVGGTVWHLVAN